MFPFSPIYPSDAIKGQLLRSIPNFYYSISVLIGSDFYTLDSVNGQSKEGKKWSGESQFPKIKNF